MGAFCNLLAVKLPQKKIIGIQINRDSRSGVNFDKINTWYSWILRLELRLNKILRYHAFHFNCSTCGVDLDHKARDVGGRLYCLPCHDKMGIPICAACRRPIGNFFFVSVLNKFRIRCKKILLEGRCVNALGKQWHPEHFVCVTCERPFSNSKVSLIFLKLKKALFTQIENQK